MTYSFFRNADRVTRDYVISYLIALEGYTSELAIECADVDIKAHGTVYPIMHGEGQFFWAEQYQSFMVQYNVSLPVFHIRHFGGSK